MRNEIVKPDRRETLHFISGEAHGIEIVIRNCPVRVLDDGSETRLEYSASFDARLVDAICSVIGDYENFRQRALTQAVPLDVAVFNAPPFSAQIHIKADKSLREFTEGLPDAVIAAFDGARIHK